LVPTELSGLWIEEIQLSQDCWSYLFHADCDDRFALYCGMWKKRIWQFRPWLYPKFFSNSGLKIDLMVTGKSVLVFT
jgi:hypothetical protein